MAGKRGRSKHDTQRTSPLIGPGGKVSKSALFRKAHGLPLAASGMAGAPLEAPATPEDPADIEGDDEAIAAALAAGATQAHEKVIEADDGDGPVGDPTAGGTLVPTSPLKVVFRLKKDLDKRLDRYLVDRVTFMSRSKIQAMIEAGDVSVNARGCKASTKLRKGDVVEVMIPPPPSEHVPPEDIPISVLYEDPHLIVLNKSPDIIVHPARSFLTGTMVNALEYHFRHRSPSGGSLSGVGMLYARPGVVHRLDRQTSGCIVFAKTDTAHWGIARQFADRTTEKRYIAFVHGLVEPGADVIDLPIGPHPSRERGYREKQVVRHDHLGRSAVTIYRVLGRYGTGAEAVSVVEVELKTGRTHQIRVHLSHRGWPLVADDMYGGRFLDLPNNSRASAGVEAPGRLRRVGLHAALLGFRHPATGERMEFRAPLPPDLLGFLQALRAAGPIDEPGPAGVGPRGAVLTLEGEGGLLANGAAS